MNIRVKVQVANESIATEGMRFSAQPPSLWRQVTARLTMYFLTPGFCRFPAFKRSLSILVNPIRIVKVLLCLNL